MLRRADAITTICEGLRSDILSRGIAPEKITVIPNAVDAQQFTLGRDIDVALRRSLGLDRSIVLGFIGSFYAYEGLDLLLTSFARLLQKRSDVKLLLVGGGPEKERLIAQTTALGIGGDVIFTGRVPHDDVRRYYDLVTLFVYPRHRMRLTELVTPLKPLEAMAQGSIVVASDVGGHKELLLDGVRGFLFPADDADALAHKLSEVIERQGSWPAMRLAGRSFVETERTWDQVVSRYAPVYERLLDQKRGG